MLKTSHPSRKPALTKAQLDDEVMELLLKENLPFNILESEDFKMFLEKVSGSEVKLLTRLTANLKIQVSFFCFFLF